MMTAVRFECPQCGARVETIAPPTYTPTCKGPPEKKHLRPIKMVSTDAAPKQARKTRAKKQRTGMIKRRPTT